MRKSPCKGKRYRQGRSYFDRCIQLNRVIADFEKKIQAVETKVPEETSPHLLLGAQDQRLGAGQDQPLCWSIGTSSGDCQDTETRMVQPRHMPRQPLQKPFLRAPWRAGDAEVGRGNAGWTTSKSEHPCPCQNCSRAVSYTHLTLPTRRTV